MKKTGPSSSATGSPSASPASTLDFRDDGSFEYLSGEGIKTSLQIFWKMGMGHKIVLSMADGVNPRSCYYKLEGDHLTFDDGSGSSCIPAEPDDMPMEYRARGSEALRKLERPSRR